IELSDTSNHNSIDNALKGAVDGLASVLFWEPGFLKFDVTHEVEATKRVGVPLIVLVLLLGGIFFTFYHRWINIRAFRHAIAVTRGQYDNPNDPGEISHFQALTSALSATVGLGNIAGVAVAIAIGGPGAVVWMIIIGILGMSAKFHESTLAQIYRQVDADGTVHGGPMYYLEIGLAKRGFPKIIGKSMAVVFAIFCIGGSFGGGNMFQANQAAAILESAFSGFSNVRWVIGCTMALLVGLVIIGGIKRIGQVTEKIIPFMCGLYVLACIVVIVSHIEAIPAAFALIFSSAFSMHAGVGGIVGVAVQGIKRAVFSNEAGIGSAAIAHSAAKTDEPVREGIVAMLGPFIDTVVICTMTALVVIVTGAYSNPAAGKGVEMTHWAFASTLSWFPTLLGISVFLFAFSTMISWSYYGEKSWQYLFGRTRFMSLAYKFIFLACVVLGSVTSLDIVITFSDLMILSMAFPNIIGGILLAPKVKELTNNYWKRYKEVSESSIGAAGGAAEGDLGTHAAAKLKIKTRVRMFLIGML
ncbi:MAG TPA: alanine:cation symporter family protein, partial [Myxococcales bacterium]|nr:alanine:cation symporter family protein [Myxococcales bacterium]